MKRRSINALIRNGILVAVIISMNVFAPISVLKGNDKDTQAIGGQLDMRSAFSASGFSQNGGVTKYDANTFSSITADKLTLGNREIAAITSRDYQAIFLNSNFLVNFNRSFEISGNLRIDGTVPDGYAFGFHHDKAYNLSQESGYAISGGGSLGIYKNNNASPDKKEGIKKAVVYEIDLTDNSDYNDTLTGINNDHTALNLTDEFGYTREYSKPTIFSGISQNGPSDAFVEAPLSVIYDAKTKLLSMSWNNMLYTYQDPAAYIGSNETYFFLSGVVNQSTWMSKTGGKMSVGVSYFTYTDLQAKGEVEYYTKRDGLLILYDPKDVRTYPKEKETVVVRSKIWNASTTALEAFETKFSIPEATINDAAITPSNLRAYRGSPENPVALSLDELDIFNGASSSSTKIKNTATLTLPINNEPVYVEYEYIIPKGTFNEKLFHKLLIGTEGMTQYQIDGEAKVAGKPEFEKGSKSLVFPIEDKQISKSDLLQLMKVKTFDQDAFTLVKDNRDIIAKVEIDKGVNESILQTKQGRYEVQYDALDKRTALTADSFVQNIWVTDKNVALNNNVDLAAYDVGLYTNEIQGKTQDEISDMIIEKAKLEGYHNADNSKINVDTSISITHTITETTPENSVLPVTFIYNDEPVETNLKINVRILKGMEANSFLIKKSEQASITSQLVKQYAHVNLLKRDGDKVAIEDFEVHNMSQIKTADVMERVDVKFFYVEPETGIEQETSIVVQIVDNEYSISNNRQNAIHTKSCILLQSEAMALQDVEAISRFTTPLYVNVLQQSKPLQSTFTALDSLKDGIVGTYDITYGIGKVGSEDYVSQDGKIKVVEEESIISKDRTTSLTIHKKDITLTLTQAHQMDEKSILERSELFVTSVDERAGNFYVEQGVLAQIKKGRRPQIYHLPIQYKTANNTVEDTVLVSVIDDGSQHEISANSIILKRSEAKSLPHKEVLLKLCRAHLQIAGMDDTKSLQVSVDHFDLLQGGKEGMYAVHFYVNVNQYRIEKMVFVRVIDDKVPGIDEISGSSTINEAKTALLIDEKKDLALYAKTTIQLSQKEARALQNKEQLLVFSDGKIFYSDGSTGIPNVIMDNFKQLQLGDVGTYFFLHEVNGLQVATKLSVYSESEETRGVRLSANNFSVYDYEVTTLTNQEMIKRAAAIGVKTLDGSDVAIAVSEDSKVLGKKGKYPITFKTKEGQQLTIVVEVLSAKEENIIKQLSAPSTKDTSKQTPFLILLIITGTFIVKYRKYKKCI